MCIVLEVSKSNFYKSQKAEESMRKKETKRLSDLIYEIWLSSKKRYGSPKILEMLRRKGINTSLRRIQKIMRKLDIHSIIVKKYKPQSTKPVEGTYENKLEQDFRATEKNQKWVSDITYIHTKKHGWCYLASILDLYTKKIIGWRFGKQMTVDLIKGALEKALLNNKPEKELILHSDRGSQYTSKEYTEYARANNLQLSYSRKGNPYDNACIESFHSIIKKELIYQEDYNIFEEAYKSIFEYIESFYNRKRIHGSIGYVTPEEFESGLKKVA